MNQHIVGYEHSLYIVDILSLASFSPPEKGNKRFGWIIRGSVPFSLYISIVVFVWKIT